MTCSSPSMSMGCDGLAVELFDLVGNLVELRAGLVGGDDVDGDALLGCHHATARSTAVDTTSGKRTSASPTRRSQRRSPEYRPMHGDVSEDSAGGERLEAQRLLAPGSHVG